MESREIHRGEIYYANLEPVMGSEQGGYRPVLILQNNTGNRYNPTVIVAAITGKPKSKMPTHVRISNIEILEKNSTVLLEQIRTIDRCRLGAYIGKISLKVQGKTDWALSVSVGLSYV